MTEQSTVGAVTKETVNFVNAMPNEVFLNPVTKSMGDRLVASVGLLEDKVDSLTDEHHTQEELYESRMFLNAHLFTLWSRLGMYPVVKSFRHHDGEACFDGEYFIVVATLPEGQVSFHYKKEHWAKFQVPQVEFGPKWDGHNTQDAHKRLGEAIHMIGIKVYESHNDWIKR